MNTKLIFVEGLPGSGKSSTAQFIALQLQRNNITAQWYFIRNKYENILN